MFLVVLISLKQYILQKFGFQLIKNKTIYSKLSKQDIQYFKTFLNKNEIIQDEYKLEIHNQDWTGFYKGNSELILIPSSINQLQNIIKYCNKRKLAVVTQSGNTSMTGQSVPKYDEIIILMKNFDKIIKFDQVNNILICEAGCKLSDVQNYLQQYGLEIPWQLRTVNMCAIGANIATNVDGKYGIKFGPLRQFVIGLEIVLGNGEILDCNNEIRSEKQGFDIKQLLIGSEGSLGIITKCNIQCIQSVINKQVIFLRVLNFQNVLEILRIIRQKFRGVISAMEFMDGHSFQCSLNNITNIFDDKQLLKYYVLIEFQNDHFEAGEQSLMLLSDFYEESLVSDNQNQFRNIWQIREDIGNACRKLGNYLLKYDVSINPSLFPILQLHLRQLIGDLGFLASYGHLMTGQIYFTATFTSQENCDKGREILEYHLYNFLQQNNGLCSGIHGIGQTKIQYLPQFKSSIEIKMMNQIKQIFDPNNILNPHKLINFE